MEKDLKKTKKILTELLCKEAREEAMEILTKISIYRFNEFMKYYESDKGNCCCLHLDLMKAELVFYGLMTQKEGDSFNSSNLF